MKTRLRFDSADWTRDRNGYGITLYTKDATAAQGFLDSMEMGKTYAAELVEEKNRRSLDSNSYCWLLIGKLSEVLGKPREEIYRHYIREIGVSDVVCIKSEAAETEAKKHEAIEEIVTLWQESKYYYYHRDLLFPTCESLQPYLDIYGNRDKFVRLIPDMLFISFSNSGKSF